MDNIYEDDGDAESIVKCELEEASLETDFIERLLSKYDCEAGKMRGIEFREQWD